MVIEIVMGAHMAHVLVIDDEDAAYRIVNHTLKEMGHSSVHADGPFKAKLLLGFDSDQKKGDLYDLIICDNFMGEKDVGIKLLQELRLERYRHPMILHTSGFLLDFSTYDFEEIGLYYVQKDMFGDTLQKTVSEILQ